jgi:hypothetical protein
LVLYVYGLLRPDLVGTGKTKSHTLRQFERLNSEIAEFDKHISLPNILTEASNHLGAGKQEQVDGSARILSLYVLNLEEIYQPSKEVVNISEYMNIGLADAAIISCWRRLKKDKVRVFTQDWELYNRLSGYEVDCVNIMHWATPPKHYKP